MPQPGVREAVWFAVAQQLGVLLVLASGTSGLEVFWFYALVAFWAGVAVIAVRRPRAFSRLDIFLVKFGFVPLFLLAMVVAAVVWRARGWW